MYLAVDVHYPDTGGARAALVGAAEPTFATITVERVEWLPTVAPYQPGAFYRRELPAYRVLMPEHRSLVIVDGYVDLDPHGRPGLGAHVYEEFGVPVIGVAKTRFRPATQAIEVCRGSSTKPLYITARGLDPATAADLVRTMAGPFRLPTALRRVDSLARAR